MLMLNFNGIEPEGLWLLAENRRRESKAFYDENKGRLKILVSEPMSALVKDITPMMSRLDRHMHLNPDGSISKIKSDARGAKDQPLYRGKVWFMLRRLGGMPVPGLWFEVSPSYYGYGLCVLNSCPKFMQFFRKRIDHSRRALGHALRPAESFGFSVGGEEYKRPKKSGLKGRISEIYNRREFFMEIKKSDVSALSRPEALFDELTDGFNALATLYRYILKLCGEYAKYREDEAQVNDGFCRNDL